MDKSGLRMNVRYLSFSIGFLSFILSFSILSGLYAEELKILESQLNENSISGVLQNQHDYPISSIIVRAEFYDKEDGHLVGVRDFGWSTKDPLQPNEKSSYKVPELDKEFPKTEFIVKAKGEGYTEEEIEGGGLFSGLIQDANKLTGALENVTKAAEVLTNQTRELNLTQTP